MSSVTEQAKPTDHYNEFNFLCSEADIGDDPDEGEANIGRQKVRSGVQDDGLPARGVCHLVEEQ